VQVDTIKSTLKPPGTMRLKLSCDKPLSNVAFKFNLRRYNQRRVMTECIRRVEQRRLMVRLRITRQTLNPYP